MRNIPITKSNITDEKKFWNWLRARLMGNVVRIENSIGQGLPDVNMCYEGRECWIELKVGHDQIKLRAAQYAWGMRRAAHGGHVFVINYCPVCDTIGVLKYPFKVVKSGDYVSPTDDNAYDVFPRKSFSVIVLG